MEHSRPQLLPTTRLQRLSTTHRASHGHIHHLLHLRHWARNRHGMHHEEDQGLRLPVPDVPITHRDVAAHEMDQGQEGAEQCLFLVLDDLGTEHDVLVIRPLLDCVCCIRSFRRLLDFSNYTQDRTSLIPSPPPNPWFIRRSIYIDRFVPFN